MSYITISKCRICGNTNLQELLNLGTHRLTGVFPKNKNEKITSGPLRIVKCHGTDVCGLVQLADSYDLNEMYGNNYGYRSGLNEYMVRHLRNKIERILSMVNHREGDLFLDIGSNDCTTLKSYPPGYNLVGIDPTGAKFQEYYPSNVKLIPDFFSASTLKKLFRDQKAKVITSFSMFYDLESPQEFMSEIEDVLDEEGVWVFEQSYMPCMLKKNSYDTICQEHLEYYALKQIKWMCDRTELKIIDVEFNDVNGGSFSVAVAKRSSNYKEDFQRINEILKSEAAAGLDTLKPWEDFSKRVQRVKKDLLTILNTAKLAGKKVIGLGASTKGNVILQFCGITPELISAIGEVNAEKYGCFTPGTYIPIIPETEAMSIKPDYILILPWHFREFFIENRKFDGFKLIFPLPTVEIVQC